MMKVASKIIDHRRQRTLSSSDTQVENVSNNENALDRHLFDDSNKIHESDDLNNTTDVHKDVVSIIAMIKVQHQSLMMIIITS